MGSSLSLLSRSCGVLLHLTSLPGGYGIGTIGRASEQFVSFLSRSGQRWWQVLPIHPAGPGDSPYSAPSAFAGNPLLIDLDRLVQKGLLDRGDLTSPRGVSLGRVCYPAVTRYYEKSLRKAHDRFKAVRRGRSAFERFVAEHEDWLEDYTLYRALKLAHQGAVWTVWDQGSRRRRAGTLNEARAALKDQIDYERFVQYVFFHQWREFKQFANAHGVGLIGDIPMFVGLDSCDVWSQRRLFRVDLDGRPKVVSGAPPDPFIATGQKWGHPLYRWAQHRTTGFGWWLARFKHMLGMFDAVRIDHFLGFHRCWAVEADAPTARHGRWSSSPGEELFTVVQDKLGPLPVIAEDLGAVTPGAIQLRDQVGFLGMRILQHGFGEGGRYDQPHNYPKRCAAYTGTHDNDTTIGWFRSLRSAGRRDRGSDGLTTRQRVIRYTGTDGREIHWDLIRLLYQSHADVVIVPMQDFVGLGSRYRMNRPGTPTGNWDWRVKSAAITEALAVCLRGLAETYERTGT